MRAPSFFALFALLLSCNNDTTVGKNNTDPEGTILEPTNNAEFDEGTLITFSAEVSDAQDSGPELALYWASDVDGPLIEAEHADTEGNFSFAVDSLSPGRHTITMTVIDLEGASYEDSIRITIHDLAEPPSITWSHPTIEEYAIEGESFELMVTVDDAQDDPNALEIVLSSDIDGELCAPSADAVGVAACDVTLSVGDHYLNAVVTDIDGNTASSEVFFEVIPLTMIDNDEDGWNEDQGDCNDNNPSIYPTAEEYENSLDDDCDGYIDEGTDAFDDDGDCFCEDEPCMGSVESSCTSVIEWDCDDADVSTYEGAPEVCDGVDNDCDGTVDDGTTCLDDDGDGFAEDEGDCDDAEDDAYPGNSEVQDGIDNDCDTAIDEGTAAFDDDGDCFCEVGPCMGSISGSCGALGEDDCNDSNPVVFPTATETCDLLDNDCDGIVDEETSCYDDDGDGYSEMEGDCDDTSDVTWPGATELLDGADNDCDGTIDEDTAVYDDDGDCFCEAGPCVGGIDASCTTLRDGDCDDSAAAISPDATETCNSVDDNCDGAIDEHALDADLWYQDADADGFGNIAVTQSSCTQPAGYLADASDCDDANALINPAAAELCNGLDDDCDGATDEDGTADGVIWYGDIDGDGYGSAGTTYIACAQPAGYLADSSDCNDADASIHPNADEYCNGIDDDCDGTLDEDSAVDAPLWYIDGDGDGYGSPATTTTACSQPGGYTADNTDCDDVVSSTHPYATEVCDEVDQDCDGVVDEDVESVFYRDADGDGYGDAASTTYDCAAPSGYVDNDEDCDDGSAAVNPESVWYIDYDGDSYGSATYYVNACEQPTGYVSNYDDCNDGAASANPGGTESCDGIDNDCDGSTDERNADGCTTHYYDYDGDGYGGSASQCLCSDSGYYTADNSDDCYDYNANANPATTTYYSTSRGDGSYDYNCDGSASKRYTSTYSCPAACYGTTTNGWSSSSPSCGSSGTYKTGCTITLTYPDFCGASSSYTATQTCR